ncbi:hypothetical protein TD95_003535 [Thielaviopsis punctulata]|uniref:HhH-GPD domain-containing protein n=1 Tax=Thielaviopsis punctulata TaxID=72032 RepID=A0A0F4Z6C1_9PEZI|nr:hypothetical protein TD95_003535 [Thielaviopsis punctulata]
MASRRSSRLASKIVANSTTVPATTLKAPSSKAPRKRKSDQITTDAEAPNIAPANPTTRKKRTIEPAVAIPTGPAEILPTEANRQTFLQDALKHLISVDARLKPLIEKHHCDIFSPEGLAETPDPWESLVSSIISQQVSGAAARSIKRRFIALFHSSATTDDPPFPTPAQVLALDTAALRTAGLSQRKAEYVHGLAAKFASGELSRTFLLSAPYDELVARLTAVRGLGLWSVEMFACFTLKRPDVCSLGDLGVQRGMAAFEGRDVARLKTSKKGKWKYMSEAEMQALAERFRPYRSIFMWYIWRAENVEVAALEGGSRKNKDKT